MRVGNVMGDVLGGMNLIIGIFIVFNVRKIIGKG